MDFWKLLLSLLFGAHLFFFSGYAIRWLFLVFYPQKLNNRITPDALESVTGYALTALLCFLSLITFGTLVYGGLIASVCSCVALFYLYKTQQLRIRKSFRFTPSFIIKIAYLSVILIIYLPSLIGKSTVFHLPPIDELPNGIAAVIAAAHAEQWPAPNPYFPELSFAYNLLFYFPLGLIVRGIAKASYVIPVYSCAVLWASWQALGMLEITMDKFKLSKYQQITGLLFATFLSSLLPFIIASDAPMGYLLNFNGLTNFNMEEPLTYSLYLPQYIFVCCCIIGSWVVYNMPPSLLRSILYSLLLSSAALSGFLFALIIFITFFLYWIWDCWKYYSTSKYQITSLVLFLCATSYFILEAKNWAGYSKLLGLWPRTGWSYFLLSEGILFLGMLMFFIAYRRKKWTQLAMSYAIPFAAALLMLMIAKDTDLASKSAFFIHSVSIVIAVMGYTWAWNKLGNFNLLKWLLFITPLAYFCCLSFILIGFYFAHSYIPYSQNETAELEKMQELPFGLRILFKEPDQQRAALSGHLVYMDFKPYRKDAYLPENERVKANIFFSKEDIDLKNKKINAIFSNNELIIISPTSSSIKPLTLSQLTNWQAWQNKSKKSELKVAFDISTLAIKSTKQLVDAALIIPLTLPEGVYQISAKVMGQVTAGSGHISLHGLKKLINIPVGNYNKPTKFSTIFQIIEKPKSRYVLAFGLGGWTQGRGHIQLKDVVIEELS
ncbi:hypothetical protein [Legionella resiliens]|uniref:Transmembrane protein n=1 Tax=Legionella resiliens TaxID=2905958 RepID=A0ABS8X6V7_9GAMM|nr:MULTISPECIES: hypothetical protein [unclassified Legionella]MCE0723361.1 hypothetical protein [Legionella sp. 9fVS26]MCE3532514.1 hypothetical protein [Legionella sp. 8cVS16]